MIIDNLFTRPIFESQMDPITQFASNAHEEWRRNFDPTGTKPRVKKNSDGTEGDINVPFEKLHPDWKKENLAAAHAAHHAVKHFGRDMEKAAEYVHNEWMKRNPKGDWNAAQHVPYDDLPEDEKEKDRVHVRTMMRLMGHHPEQGVAEGLNEFAPDGFNGGDDDEEFSPEIAKMAEEDGFTKGVSLADGATTERAMAIQYWHIRDGGMYKQYFAKGFKAGRMNKVNHGNKQYNLNLKLMKDGSIRHGEQGVAEGSVAQLPTRGADYSKYDTDHLKMMLRPGILHRNETRFKALIRKELQKREQQSQQGVAEGSAANDYFTRRKSEEERIAGTRAPAKNKKNPANTDYAKRRKQQDVDESFRNRPNHGREERHDLDPSDWYKKVGTKMYTASIYPRQVAQAQKEGWHPTKEQARANASPEGVAEGLSEMDKSQTPPGRDGHVSHGTYGSRDKKDPDAGKKQYYGKMERPEKTIKTASDILNKAFNDKGVAEGQQDDPEDYRAHLIKTLPAMMNYFAKTGKGWSPSKEQLLAAVDTAYEVMKHTGDVQQAGKALMDELNTLHRMSQGQQGVAESYPKHQDLSGISTEKLKAYLAKHSGGGVPTFGEGNQVKRVRAELQRRQQGVAEGEYNPDTFVGKKGTYKGYGITQEGPYQWGISSSLRKFSTLAAAKRHIDKNMEEGVAEERTSAAVRMQRAADRQRAKSDASLRRTPSSIPKKQEPKKTDTDAKTVSEHRVKRRALMAQMLKGR
jgi:hypothetical protein